MEANVPAEHCRHTITYFLDDLPPRDLSVLSNRTEAQKFQLNDTEDPINDAVMPTMGNFSLFP